MFVTSRTASIARTIKRFGSEHSVCLCNNETMPITIFPEPYADRSLIAEYFVRGISFGALFMESLDVLSRNASKYMLSRERLIPP
ncbi:unnamed protein product [Onchocerca flexuosa]|uniref:Uncharacterized protein n=1 Tax=Onchocerca flexuosa TaxID=387005 RepID=A0A183HGN1_9BILA|nr:unnamed protein product [Onchocerca flexuosa]